MVLKLNLITFLKKINEYSIKFEYETFKTEINFCDTTLFKVDNKLRTKVYVKSTDRQSCLHSKSEHPNSTKKAFPLARHQSSIKFATIEAIFITIVNSYLTC